MRETAGMRAHVCRGYSLSFFEIEFVVALGRFHNHDCIHDKDSDVNVVLHYLFQLGLDKCGI